MFRIKLFIISSRFILVMMVATFEINLAPTRDMTAEIKSIERSQRQIKPRFTPLSFPRPGEPQCAHTYLDLSYICDPDVWLAHTDAIRLDRLLSPKKFLRCDTDRRRSRNQLTSFELHNVSNYRSKNSHYYSLGFALVDALQYDNLDKCPHADSVQYRFVDPDSSEERENGLLAATFLKRAAQVIKKRWNIRRTKGQDFRTCAMDVFILLTRSLTICLRNQIVSFRKRVFHGRQLAPMISVIFGTRLQVVFDDDSFSNLLNGLSSNRPFPAPEEFRGPVDIMSHIFLILNASLLEGDHDSSGDNSTSSQTTTDALPRKAKPDLSHEAKELARKYRAVKYTIPSWAKAVFIISGGISLACFLIGHCINTGVRKSRYANVEGRTFFATKSGHRHWRAGFAGGMVEMRNTAAFSGVIAGMTLSNVAGHSSVNAMSMRSIGGLPLKIPQKTKAAGIGGFARTSQTKGVNRGGHGGILGTKMNYNRV